MQLTSGIICNNYVESIKTGSAAHPTRKFNYRGTGILPVADIAARYQMLTGSN